jgi:uncharacterized protein YunC (DUF1805 family)
MNELILFASVMVALLIMLAMSKNDKTKEPFLQIKNNLGWAGCGLIDWF